MTRYSGEVGIRDNPIETSPGVWEEVITSIPISGRIDRKPMRWSAGERSQENVKINHIISFISPETLFAKFSNAVYATYQGSKWTVVTIDYFEKRIRLGLGGLYNGGGNDG